MTKSVLASLFAVDAVSTASLPAQEMHRFTANIGAGFTTPLGTAGSNLDMGWNIRGGIGMNFNPWVGANIDLGYNSMGVTSSVLSNLGYGGGNLNIFSATLDPVVHLMPRSHVDVYLTGGGGFYHQYQNLTQPGLIEGTGFDPFFGFYPAAVPVNIVVASYSVNKPGIDGGMGIAFGSKWHGRFFGEARFNRIFNGSYHTDYLPVTFGYRW